VWALDAYRARQLRRPFVFIGGLVEGQWPAVRHEQAFFDDRERRRLGLAGVPLDLSSDLQHDETYLFYLACAVADRRLTLSYPTMDPGGEPLLASQYVAEVTRLFASGALPVRERPLSEIVPPPAEAVCLRELLEHVTQHDESEPLTALVPQLPEREQRLADHALAMAAVEKQRYSWERFEAHDGVLASATIHERLADAFGPSRKWSASALGQYGACPFRFFLERVLRLQVLEMPQEEIEMSDLGRLAHIILRRFFKDHQARYPENPVAAQDPQQAQAAMRQIVTDTFAEWERQGLVTHRKLWELSRQQMHDNMAALVAHEQAELADSGLVPRAFETRYSISVAPEEGAEPLRLHGVIDRVDVAPRLAAGEAPHYAVYDYKGGAGTSPNAIAAGLDFQMPFYALGARDAVLGGADPAPQCLGWAYYLYRQPAKLTHRVGNSSRFDTPDEYIAAALGWAAAHVWNIRRGRFPVAPSDCSYCDFDSVCRFFPWRSEAKAGGDADAS
jgi:ATP-dependent helicase/DNAse subunit B